MTPFKVGHHATLTVLYSGQVEARDGSTVTIAGHPIPTTLGPGVRTVSIGRLSAVCDRAHCDDGDCDEADTPAADLRGVDGLLRAVLDRHLEHHDGALRYCRDPVCSASQEVPTP